MIKEMIYTWMKTLAFYYLLFSVFLQLVPDASYEKYIRFFMGLLLVLLFCTPLLTLLGKNSAFVESFSAFYENENQWMEKNAVESWERMEAEIRNELERKYGFEMENDSEENSFSDTGSLDDVASDRYPSGSSFAAGY